MLLKMSLNHLWREKHYPEFRVMAAALFLAVFAVSTLLILTQAIKESIVGDASTLIGADLILESPEPIPQAYQHYAKEIGLAQSTVIDFFSMISTNNKSTLVAISAIDGKFPLRGKLSISQGTQIQERQEAPASSQVWLADTLALKLNSNQGDPLSIGEATFINDGIIIQRPVALSDSSVLAPIAYVNAKDLPKMAVLQPGSRVTYRMLVAGSQEKITQFENQFKQNEAITWVTAKEGRPAINRIIGFSQRYLVIILLIQMLLAGVAIALCSHQYSIRQQKNIALWKSFGAQNKIILSLQFVSLSLLALLVMSVAISASYCASLVILKKSQFTYAISQINWQGGALGAFSGLIIFVGFGLGGIWQLKRVSPLQLLQRQVLPSSRIGWVSAILAVFLIGVLFSSYLQESDVSLHFGLYVGCLSAIAFALAYVLWSGFQILAKHGPLTWRFGIAYMMRHKSNSITQWFVFMLVIMLLLLLQIIQKDFVSNWKEELPPQTPNTFLINIQRADVPKLQQWFTAHQLSQVSFYPIVRGRMSHINGKRIEEINQQSQEKKGLQRSINLTWMRELPADNQIMAGLAWQKVPNGQALISVEKRFSERQGLGLGDSISFQVADKQVTGKIVQIRTVQWESFKPNFFVIFPPNVLEGFPHSYMTSVYLPANQKQDLINVAKNYPQISIIDIDSLLQEARVVIDKLTNSLQGLLILVFILGVLIMFASILSCLKERLNESAMLQILGANRRFVVKVLSVEFGVLGFLSGGAGSLMAYVIASDLAQRYFDFSLKFNFTLFGIGVIVSILAVLFFGLFGTRKVFQVSPLWLLRQTN